MNGLMVCKCEHHVNSCVQVTVTILKNDFDFIKCIPAVRAQLNKEGDREEWIPFCGTGIKSRASGMLSKYSTKTHRYKKMNKRPK